MIKKTNIVATLGPAVTGEFWSMKDLNDSGRSEELTGVINTVDQLLQAGVDCLRLNFSHGTTEEQLVRLKMIRDVQLSKLNEFSPQSKGTKYLTVLLDTKGPEIRVEPFRDDKAITYNRGDQLVISCKEKVLGNKDGFSVTDSKKEYDMSADCVVGNSILVDDGKLSLLITKVDKKSGLVHVVSQNSHTLRKNKRVNLPNANYTLDFLSEKDKNDIALAVKNSLDVVALSFVNTKENVEAVRTHINNLDPNSNLKVFSKIETVQSLKNIDEIIAVSDGIMIARGDLGLESRYESVPFWTEEIINKCHVANIPVIVATQMLDSLEKNILPTRAEVSDVYRATQMGSDCTMLSGETAQGLFPVNSVQVMSKINETAEGYKFKSSCPFRTPEGSELDFLSAQLRLKLAFKEGKKTCLLLEWNDENILLARKIASLKSSVNIFLFLSAEIDFQLDSLEIFASISNSLKKECDLNLLWGVQIICVNVTVGNEEKLDLTACFFNSYADASAKDCNIVLL